MFSLNKKNNIERFPLISAIRVELETPFVPIQRSRQLSLADDK